MTIANSLQKSIANRKPNKNKFSLVVGWILLVLTSPVFLVMDAFRPSQYRKIILAYLWFMVLIMVITAVFYCGNEKNITRLERLLGRFFYPEEDITVINKETIEFINRYAVMFNINPQLISAIIQVESSNNPNARSPKGASGLMQIMPAVWRQYNPDSKCDGRHLPGKVDHGEDCIYGVEANIRTGVRHLRFLIDYFNGDTGMAIEAYNAGLTNVDPDRKRPKFQETRNYLHRIATVMAPSTTNKIMQELTVVSGSKVLFRRMLIISLVLWGILVFWILKRVLKIF